MYIYFAFSGIFNAVISTIFGVFILLKNSKSGTNRTFAYFSFSVAAWSYGYIGWPLSKTSESTLLWFQILHIGACFTPVTYYHFVITWLNLFKKKYKIILKIGYVLAFFFGSLTFSKLFIAGMEPKFSLRFWAKPGILYHFYLLYFFTIVLVSTYLLLKRLSLSSGIKKQQIKYILIGISLSFIGGSTNYLLWYDINIPPYGNILASSFVILTFYAIVTYRLMDIKLVITKVSLLIFVYALLLGTPFLVGFLYQHQCMRLVGRYWWLIPIALSTVFATVAPSIYLFLQQKAEGRILQEEIRIRALLTKASYGMAAIRDLQRLLEIIVDILTKHLRLDNAAIYLSTGKHGAFLTAEPQKIASKDAAERFSRNESDKNKYVLKVSKSEYKSHVVIGDDDPIVERLKEKKSPLIYEEIKLLAEGHTSKSADFQEIAKQMKELSASVIVPAIAENILLGFIVLGERKDKGIYSPELIDVLSVLGNQSALAIENCRYWEESRRRMLEEGFQERVASLDAMAASFAHEIDNPVGIILGQIGCAEEVLDDNKDATPKIVVDEVKGAFKFITESAVRVSGMVKSILEYSRMGSGELVSVSIYDVVEGFENLMGPQLRKAQVGFSKDIEEGLPNLKADKVQMEEILMNFAINSLHAFKDKTDKKVNLKIFQLNDGMIRIEFSDNGYGIPEKMLNDIFLASVTTKGSSEGTGLGLFRTRKIVDMHGGKIWAESEGEGKGATFIVELPVYKKGDKIVKSKNIINKKKVF